MGLKLLLDAIAEAAGAGVERYPGVAASGSAAGDLLHAKAGGCLRALHTWQ